MTNLVPLEEFMGDAPRHQAGMVPLEDFGGSTSREDPATYALKVFLSHGWSKEQAAGMVGNLIHESAMSPTAKGDGGASFGIAQWNGERLKGLEGFAAARGASKADLNTQLDYVIHELENTETAAAQALRSTIDVVSATRIFSEKFERPGRPMMESRLAHARNIYDPESYRHIEQGEFMAVAGAADLGFGLSPDFDPQPGELYRKVRSYFGLDREPQQQPGPVEPKTYEDLSPEEKKVARLAGKLAEPAHLGIDEEYLVHPEWRTPDIVESELYRVLGRFVDGYTASLTEGLKQATWGDTFKPETVPGMVIGEGAYLAGQILGPFKWLRGLTGRYLFPSVSGLRTTGQILSRGMKEGAVNLGLLQGLSRVVPAMIENEDAESWALEVIRSARTGALVGAAFPLLAIIPGKGVAGTGLRMATGFAVMDYMRAAPGKFSTLGDFYRAYQTWDPESKEQFASLAYQYLLDLYFARTVRPIREQMAAHTESAGLQEVVRLNPQEMEKDILGVTGQDHTERPLVAPAEENVVEVETPAMVREINPDAPPVIEVPEKPPETAGIALEGEAAAARQAPPPAVSPEILRVPTENIRQAPEDFQYKLGADPKTGAGLALKDVGKWNDGLAGVLTLWRDHQGKLFVVNGHQRLALAQRTETPEVNARILDSAEWTKEQARAYGARMNIAEGRGTPVDMAKFLRDSGLTPEDLAAEGVSLTEAKTRQGLALANLGDNIFHEVALGRLPVERGAIIGEELAGNHPAQDALLKGISRLEISNEKLRELVRLAKHSPTITSKQLTLFGPEELKKNLLLESAELLSYAKKQLRREKAVFGVVDREKGRLTEAGNVIDPDTNQVISRQAAEALDILDKAAYLPESQSGTTLKKFAELLATSKKPRQTKEEFYGQIKEALNADRVSLARPGREAGRGVGEERPEVGEPVPGGGEGAPGGGEVREVPTPEITPAEMGADLFGALGPKKLYAGVPGPETGAILARLREGASEARSLWADLKTNIREVVAPGTLPGAQEVAQGLITMMGRKNEAINQAHFRLLEFRDLFRKTQPSEWGKLAATWQAGGKTGTDLDRAYEVYREISDALVPRIRDFRDLAYQENYLRQAWRNARDQEFKSNIGKFLEGKPFKNYLDLDERGHPRLYEATFAEDGSYTLERREGTGEPAKSAEERPKPLTSLPRGRSLTGGRGYFKKKVIPDWQTGLMLGGVPKFKNLFDLMIWDIGEKNQFIWGNAFIRWARERGYLQYVSTRNIPPGWARINDPRGLVNHPYLKEIEPETRPFEEVPGDYDMTAPPRTEARVLEYALVAPQEAARIVNNFLSPGLRGQPVYNLYRRLVDPLRRLGVSFSTFHLRFTMNNSLATGTGQAVSRSLGNLFSGDLKGAAQATKSGGVNLTGAQFVRELKAGKALTEAFYEGTDDPVIKGTLRRFIDSGGTLPAPEAMLPMTREVVKGVWQSLVELGRAHPFRALEELVEASSRPIMTYAVPFAKLGAFPVLERALQNRLEAKYAKMGPETPELAAQREAEYRQGLFDINKHLDNIYGQMNYDSLLLNRKIKDLLFFVIRFPGWNIGSGRWLAGKISGMKKIAAGKEISEYERESLRSGLGFVINMGIYSTLLYWFINGRPPESVWELYSKGVWTGGYTRGGNKEYIRDASYWRDLWGMFPFGQHGEFEPGKPIETVKVKAADIWRVPVEVFDNREAYSGYQIFTPGEPSRWAEEGLKYLGKQGIPYSFRGMAMADSPWGKFGSFVGWTPTPTRLTDTPAMREMRRHWQAQAPRMVTTVKQEDREVKRDIMDLIYEGDGPGFLAALRQARSEGRITSTQYKSMVRDGYEILRDPHYGPLRSRFRKLPLGVAIKVFGLANPEEREALADIMQGKWGRAGVETRRKYRAEFLDLKRKITTGE